MHHITENPSLKRFSSNLRRTLAQWLLGKLLYEQEVRGSIPLPVKDDTMLPTARHRCDVSL